MSPYTNSYISETQPENRHLRVVHADLAPARDWPLEMGDAVHNLRCALDHLIWTLIERYGRTPPGRAQFPIFEDDASPGWTDPKGITRRTLAQLHPDQVGVIESVQPYQWKHLGLIAANHPLARLARLDNHDKHRNITTLVGKAVFTAFDVQAVADCTVVAVRPRLGVPLDVGAEIGQADIDPTGPDPKVQVNTEYTCRILLEDGRDAVEILGEMTRYVTDSVTWALGVPLKIDPDKPWP